MMSKTAEKRTYVYYRISGLVAAPPGWRAAFTQEDGSLWFSDVACFALAEEQTRECETDRVIKTESNPGPYAIVGTDFLDIADKAQNFAGIYGPNDPPPTDLPKIS